MAHCNTTSSPVRHHDRLSGLWKVRSGLGEAMTVTDDDRPLTGRGTGWTVPEKMVPSPWYSDQAATGQRQLDSDGESLTSSMIDTFNVTPLQVIRERHSCRLRLKIWIKQ